MRSVVIIICGCFVLLQMPDPRRPKRLACHHGNAEEGDQDSCYY